ncbi:MAG: hypothetical protein DCC68_06360 [Planctomycetota bacterium]|nr:MAG: hypothetical protein DCC68_06360 [Planctomycetota bacterium]
MSRFRRGVLALAIAWVPGNREIAKVRNRESAGTLQGELHTRCQNPWFPRFFELSFVRNFAINLSGHNQSWRVRCN